MLQDMQLRQRTMEAAQVEMQEKMKQLYHVVQTLPARLLAAGGGGGGDSGWGATGALANGEQPDNADVKELWKNVSCTPSPAHYCLCCP